MCVSSNSNIIFLCKICNTNIKDTDSAAQCDICQFWIHIKCNNLNHIDCIESSIETFANLSLLFTQVNNFSPERKNEPKNVVNSIMTLTNFKL